MDDRRQPPFPWQTLANLLFISLITLGGYVWNTTVQRTQILEATVASRGERIAVLEVRTSQQEETIRVLRGELQRMNDKLDLLVRRTP